MKRRTFLVGLVSSALLLIGASGAPIGIGTQAFDFNLSTTETSTGRKYLGDDVYSKVIDMVACPNATTKTVAHGVSGGMDFILTESGVMGGTSGGVFVPFSHAYSANGYDYWQVDTANAGLITVGTAANRSSITCTAVLYYTKP